MALTTVSNAGLGGSIDLTAKVTGTLPIANGGTNSTSTTYCDLTANVTGLMPDSNLAAPGKIGQCIQVFKSDVTSTTSSSFVDITGITLAITPSATSSKILVMPNLYVSTVSAVVVEARLYRDSTIIAGDDVNDELRFFGDIQSWRGQSIDAQFIDSPATTSAVTYKLQWLTGGGTLYLNRPGAGTVFGASSTLTLWEILA